MARKGISPVVAVVILIGIAVMAGGLLSSWVSSFMSDSAKQDTCPITTMYTISEATYNSTSGGLMVKVKNAGNDQIYNFTFEADNGTEIVLVPAGYPAADFVLGGGRTQYVSGNASLYNITAVQTVTILTGSCPSYSPSPVKVADI